MSTLELLSRQELIEKAIVLWRRHGSDYRTLLKEYHNLLEQKRKMIKSGEMRRIRLDTIKKSDLALYPEIEFLDYSDEIEAKHYISLLDNHEIVYNINLVKSFAESALTKTLKARVYDYDYQIRHCKDRKSIYGINPEACSGKGRHTHQTQLSYTASLNVSEK